MDYFSTGEILELTAEIVSAYVQRNSVPTAELPGLLEKIHDTLTQVSGGEGPTKNMPTPLTPAVSVKKSITDDYLISLEDGQKFKSLKRHLMASYGMTPDQYRAKWNLPSNYPMVAPNYAKSRSALALSLGLGRKRNAALPKPAPVETAPASKIAAKKTAAEPAIAEAANPAKKPRKPKVEKAA